MMHGYSLSASMPEEFGLVERFWYWRGASGQSYIHSIYSPDQCPPVAGAVFVVVRRIAGLRQAVRAGRFGSDGVLPEEAARPGAGDEIHVHLLTREPEAAARVLRDLEMALDSAAPVAAEPRPYRKPVQLDLLAA